MTWHNKIDLVTIFFDKLRWIEQAEKDIDSIEKGIAPETYYVAYKGMLLWIVIALENLIEEMVIWIMCGKLQSNDQSFKIKSKLIPFNNPLYEEICQTIAYHWNNYTDWLPSDKAIGHIKKLFDTIDDKDSGTFMALYNKDNQKIISDLFTIRHAIAHESKHSMSKFNEIIPSSFISNWTDRPGEFLNSSAVGWTQLKYYLIEVSRIWKELFSALK